MMAERSTALPFADKPKNLNGELVGDAGFDPFKFSDTGDLAKFRAAELKHGRVAMVTVVGILFQEHFQWNEAFPGKAPLESFRLAPALGIAQILLGIAAYEVSTSNYEGRVPGDLGFDPLKLSANGINEKWALSEIKHARLAMLGALGLVIQAHLSEKPILEQTFDWAKSFG